MPRGDNVSTDIIQAHYEQLDQIAARFGNQAESISNMLARINRASKTLEQGDWEGRGIAAFTTEMNSVCAPATQRLIAALQQAQRVTLDVSQSIARAEEEAARPFMNGEPATLLPGQSPTGSGSTGAGANGAGGGANGVGGGTNGAASGSTARSGQFDKTATAATLGTSLQPMSPSAVFNEDYMKKMIGRKIRGGDDPELNNLMESLLKNPTGSELNQTLDRIAEIRGVPPEEFRAQYERFVELQRSATNTNGIPDQIDLEERGNFLGSTASLRYGQVVGDVLGIDPVLASLLNPTGGIVGPGNGYYHPGDNDSIGYHGIFHDAAGYLYNYHDTGPGYDYLNQELGRPTGDPLTGQLSGTRWWLNQRQLDAPGPDFIVENPVVIGAARGVGAVLLDIKTAGVGLYDGFRNLFDGEWGDAADSFGDAIVGVARIPYDIAVTTVETIADTVEYIGDGIVNGVKSIGRAISRLFS